MPSFLSLLGVRSLVGLLDITYILSVGVCLKFKWIWFVGRLKHFSFPMQHSHSLAVKPWVQVLRAPELISNTQWEQNVNCRHNWNQWMEWLWGWGEGRTLESHVSVRWSSSYHCFLPMQEQLHHWNVPPCHEWEPQESHTTGFCLQITYVLCTSHNHIQLVGRKL